MNTFSDAEIPAGPRRGCPAAPVLASAALAALALVSWILDWPALGGLWMGAVPMAPATAWCTLLLAAALYLRRLGLPVKAARSVALGIPLAVAVFVLPSVWSAVSLLLTEGGALLSPGKSPLWRMSPVTALLLLLLAGAILLEELSAFAAASAAGTLALLSSALILVGYIHGLPFLENTRVIPVAFTTALSFVLLSAALLAAAPERLPARLVSGPSLRARLLRVFLPLVIAAVLADGAVDRLFPGINPALLHGIVVLTAIPVLSLLTAWLARRVGDAEARAAETLRFTQDRFRRFYMHMPDGYARVGMDGRILECNAAYERLTGYTAAELGELTYRDITPEKWQALELPVVEKIVKEGTSGVYEKEYRRKDGTLVPVELHAALDRDEAGRPRGMWAIVRDVTEKKRMESELLQSQKIESLGVLAGGIAHDFNNMLTGITANLSLLASRSPESADLLGDALAAARSAQSLTTQLLSFSKGGQPVKRETDMSRALTEIFNLSTRGTSARTELRIADGLWSAEVDEDQVKQAVNNLLINGLQAMPGGGVLRLAAENLEVPAGAAGSPGPGRYVRITVSDTGTGIPSKYLGRVFEPYFTTKTKGHGLGLAMAWGVVRSHGGHIEVSSSQGEGTVFSVCLPATGRAPLAAGAAPGKVIKGSGRVLLLEDEPIVSKAAGRMLADLGYSSELTVDGTDTLRVYEAAARDGRPFDAVILDLTIPGGMGGKEAGAELRRRHPGAVLIVSSGYSEEAVMSDYRANGFDAVIPKPYSYEELAGTLSKLLGKT